MTIRTQYPYQHLRIVSGGGTLVMELWICYIPLDKAQRTNRTFGLLSIRKPGLPILLDLACRPWCGSPSGSSRKTGTSSNANRKPMTGRAPTGTMKCFP